MGAIQERIAFYAGQPKETLWLAFGLLGQLIFASRFLVQWLVSERRGRSTMPVAFWYLSLAGSLITIVYGLYRLEPVIIVGQFGFIIYARNLMLIHRERKSHEPSP
jgi:lipid-A-disaccharide synthase-like uncharacterized protein